jgi:hypothetical protein
MGGGEVGERELPSLIWVEEFRLRFFGHARRMPSESQEIRKEGSSDSSRLFCWKVIARAFAIQLAMAAAVAAASAVDSVVTVESIATTEAMIASAVPTAVAPVAIVAATTVIATAIIAATVEAATVVAAAIPRAGADEDAADKIVRPIVAVRSASVRIVAVVTVGTDRRRAVDGTYSNGHANLGVGAARGEEQNS